MTQTFYYIISAVLSAVILYGISLMSRVRTAVAGNLLSAGASAVAIILTLTYFEVFSQSTALAIILVCVAIGTFLGLYLARVVKMIQMPEMVGAFNGVGGAASALVGGSAMFYAAGIFELTTAVLAVLVGTLTFTGSFIAAGKLAGMIDGRPVHWRGHQAWINIAILLSLACIVLAVTGGVSKAIILPAAAVFSGFLGIAIAIRVGGADMPITISLLNSLSGVAGAIAGMAIGDILLVSVGGIVGASGLLLTQIMCRAMNSSLGKILQGKTSIAPRKEAEAKATSGEPQARAEAVSPAAILAQAKDVIIVPGYGMALAQAQHLVKKLADALEARGARVRYAIHPVAGRMPGHMNVLLSEADVPYEQLYELEAINDEFAQADACVVVGANDVINPAARDTTDTPISGMPILNADQAKHIIICNYDLKPGYAGVDNPIYSRTEGVSFLLGDAAETLQQLLDDLQKQGKEEKAEPAGSEAAAVLAKAGKVIIVPGYGMALAQAQHLVKRLADELERRGAEVKYAIHPVAGRMPGHMNVLLAEANVPYDEVFELEDINSEFSTADVAFVIGANDVTNPAAKTDPSSAIFGMPILDVEKARTVLFVKRGMSSGYAGVENELFFRDNTMMLFGDAKKMVEGILKGL